MSEDLHNKAMREVNDFVIFGNNTKLGIRIELKGYDEEQQKFPQAMELLINFFRKKFGIYFRTENSGKEYYVIEEIEKYLQKIDTPSFFRNYEFILSTTSNFEKIETVFFNNPRLFETDIYDALETYVFLVGENILTKSQLDRLLFKSSSKKTDVGMNFVELLGDMIRSESIPDFQILLEELTPSYKRELLDRLEYIKVMRLLETNEDLDKKYDEARVIFNSSLFDTIVERDEKEISKINVKYSSSSNIFKGIKMALYRELEGIREGLFDELWEYASKYASNELFMKFYNSLTFSNYYLQFHDDKSRIKYATYLKNEIVGKLTYTYLLFKEKQKYEPSIELLLKNAVLTMHNSTYQGEDEYLLETLKMNPYAYDMFRSIDDKGKEIITPMQVRYSHIALEYGYVFDKSELDEYDRLDRSIKNFIHDQQNHDFTDEQLEYLFGIFQVNHNGNVLVNRSIIAAEGNSKNVRDYYKYQRLPLIMNYRRDYADYKYTIIHVLEYINNKIEIPKIDKKNRVEYVNQVRELIKEFIRDRSDSSKSKEKISDGLFEILRALDLFLRSNYEGISQKMLKGDRIEETQNEIFSRTSNATDIDRILYSIYNCNRLAHDTVKIGLMLEYIPQRSKRRAAGYELDRVAAADGLVTYIDAFKTLVKYGFNIDIIKYLLERKPRLYNKLIEEPIEGKEQEYIDKIKIGIDEAITIPYPLTNQDYLDIAKYFKVLSTCTKFDKIEQYAYEQSLFYETKTMLAEELTRELLSKLNINVLNVISYNKEQKRKFYKENGYVIEAQFDPTNNSPILVFYSKKFKEPFSVHLISLDQNLADIITTYLNNPNREDTISHFKIEPPGLTLRTSKYELIQKGKRIKNINIPTFIRQNGNNLDVEYSVALYNYINYDIHDEILEQVENNTFTKESLKELLKDFSDIDSKNLKYEGENKLLLDSLYRNLLLQMKDEIRNKRATEAPVPKGL